MKATICLRDFNSMAKVVNSLMEDACLRDPMNSITIDFEPHAGGYRLFVTVNESIKGIYGTFRTEILGDE